MKKTILTITAAAFILFTIISTCSTSYTQSTHPMHKTPEFSDDDQQASSAEITENNKEPPESSGINASHNQTHSINGAKEAENLQNVTSNIARANESSENCVNTSQDENAWTDTPPPDGHVYWTPEPPYAYTPTYTPNKWIKIPIMPIEPN